MKKESQTKEGKFIAVPVGGELDSSNSRRAEKRGKGKKMMIEMASANRWLNVEGKRQRLVKWGSLRWPFSAC